MGIETLDAMFGSFVLVFALIAIVDGLTWIGRQLRGGKLWRRLRGAGEGEDELAPNAGFSLGQGGRSSAARRHFSRQEALRLRPKLGWRPARHRDPSDAPQL